MERRMILQAFANTAARCSQHGADGPAMFICRSRRVVRAMQASLGLIGSIAGSGRGSALSPLSGGRAERCPTRGLGGGSAD